MEDARLPKSFISGELVGGAGCVRAQEKECMGCFLDDLRASAAQDEGERRRTVEREAEHFMAKCIAAEKARARLRHAVICPNVTGRTKERTAQCKRARVGSLAIVH